jgi:hypothetical protein
MYAAIFSFALATIATAVGTPPPKIIRFLEARGAALTATGQCQGEAVLPIMLWCVVCKQCLASCCSS